MGRLAVDFGTTNTVVAAWREATASPETLRLPGLSTPAQNGLPPLVPSWLYVLDGQGNDVLAGQAVQERGYDGAGDGRLFTSFKRGIAASARPLSREIDGALWGDDSAGRVFLTNVFQTASQVEGTTVEELVLTVPVQSFEKYLKWLRDGTLAALGTDSVEQVRIVDEATAAALGYDVRAPGALILVFDFGGGTLDVALVRMPSNAEESSLLVDANQPGEASSDGDSVGARVIAKAGTLLGGDDIDTWLLDELLNRCGVARADIGSSYPPLKQATEAAKIRLSTQENAEVNVTEPDGGQVYQTTFTRAQFEALLEAHDFYDTLQRTIDRALRAARQQGVFPEDVDAVLMVGGSSLIPSVGRQLRSLFGCERVREQRPFEAIAHGALELAAGAGLDDILYHSYGLRHRLPDTTRTEYEEIIAAGTRYPLDQPVEITLTASREAQEAVELVIGEVEEHAGGMTEVLFGEHAILMVDDGVELRRVVPLNDEGNARTVAHLDPPGVVQEDRIKAAFNVDRNRMLRVTVTDLRTQRTLLRDVAVVELR